MKALFYLMSYEVILVLNDLFALLSYGELSNLAISGNGSGSIVTANQPQVINYINEALLRLYSRFVLAEDELLLQLDDGITIYHLTPPYSQQYVPKVGEFSQPVRYIYDLPEKPFQDDLIKVMEVRDSYGRKIKLNDEGSRYSVFTPRVKTLQVTAPRCGEALSVVYQKRHPQILVDLQEQIWCPDVLLSALTAYIAYKVNSHMNSPDSNAKAQEFMATYEALCVEVIDRDLVNSSISQTNTRFTAGGWV